MEYGGSILERWASPMAQQVKIPPAMQKPQEMWVQFLGWEDPLEEEMATHSSILAWIIPWTEEPGGPRSMWSQTVGHNWLNTHSTSLHDSDAFVWSWQTTHIPPSGTILSLKVTGHWLMVDKDTDLCVEFLGALFSPCSCHDAQGDFSTPPDIYSGTTRGGPLYRRLDHVN